MLTGNSLSVNAQGYAWAKGLGGGSYEAGNDIAADKAGNVYITGYYQSSTMDFGGIATLTSAGGDDVFLAKYDAGGNPLWAKSIGGSGAESGNGVAADGAGNVYITGSFSGTVDFNPGAGAVTLTSAGGDVFLAKYDTAGNFIWARKMGGSGTDEGKAIALDTAGNIYITGYFSNTADFGGTVTLVATGTNNNDIFITKYDTAGNCVWAKGIGGANTDHGNSIAVNRSGDVFITGSFGGAVDFNPGSGTATLTSIGSSDAFAAEYDGNGNYLWARNMGGNGSDITGYGIAADGGGNAYVTGVFTADADFNPGTAPAVLTSEGVYDVFLVKYDPAGNYVWARNVGGSDDDWGMDIATDESGYVYITGMFPGSVDFDPGADTAFLRTSGSFFDYDIFLAKYDTAGSYVWARNVGGSSGDEGYGIAVDGSGNIYCTGYFEGPADFDPDPATTVTLASVGGYDVFTLKLSCSDTSSSRLAVTLDCGEGYDFNGTVYTTAGTYIQVIPNAAGCDSTITLDLSYNPIAVPTITVNEYTLGVNGVYATYQWIKNDTAIPGATANTYAVTENAGYRVAVTNQYGCADTSEVYDVTNVGIERTGGLAQHIRVYPNPASDMLYIQSPVKVNVMLTDITGKVIREARGARNLSLKDLAGNLYLLQVRDVNGGLIKMEKILKQ